MNENHQLQPQDKFVVRLPDGMRDRIKLAASKNNRSMNAEIVATLEEKYPIALADIHHVAKSIMLMLHNLDDPGKSELIERMSAANPRGIPAADFRKEIYIVLDEITVLEKELGRPLSEDDFDTRPIVHLSVGEK